MKSIIFCSVVVVILIFTTIFPTIFPVHGESYLDQVNQHYDSSLWGVGDNLQEGDLFQYKICGDKTIFQVIHPYHCYNIELEFVTILESYQGKVWVVQGNFTTPVTSEQMIFLIDPINFKVSTDKLNVDLGNSLENTIFSLSVYGKKSLSIGTVWDTIPSYFTNDVPLEIKNQQLLDTPIGIVDSMVLGYDVVISSNYYISTYYPFPVKADIFSSNIIFPQPVELYYYELVSYSNKNQDFQDVDLPVIESILPPHIVSSEVKLQ